MQLVTTQLLERCFLCQPCSATPDKLVDGDQVKELVMSVTCASEASLQNKVDRETISLVIEMRIVNLQITATIFPRSLYLGLYDIQKLKDFFFNPR